MDFSEEVSPWYKENRNIIAEKQFRKASKKAIEKRPSQKRKLHTIRLANL